MDQSWLTENESECRRLFDLTAKLTDDDLARPLPNGCTVATKLAHLAFWDQYRVTPILHWERNGFTTSCFNTDALNQAVHILSTAIPPSSVPQSARVAAEAGDRKVATLSPERAQPLKPPATPACSAAPFTAATTSTKSSRR